MGPHCQFAFLALQNAIEDKRFSTFVNLGARDGVCQDPLFDLMQDPAGVDFALAVEMFEQHCSEHRRNLPHVKLLCMQLTAGSMDKVTRSLPPTLTGGSWRKSSRAEKLLQAAPELDIVKVDLDAADCDVLEAF